MVPVNVTFAVTALNSGFVTVTSGNSWSAAAPAGAGVLGDEERVAAHTTATITSSTPTAMAMRLRGVCAMRSRHGNCGADFAGSRRAWSRLIGLNSRGPKLCSGWALTGILRLWVRSDSERTQGRKVYRTASVKDMSTRIGDRPLNRAFRPSVRGGGKHS